MQAHTLDRAEALHSPAYPTVPVLPLGAGGPFELSFEPEGGPIDRMTSTMCLLKAVRGAETWTLDWNGPDEAIVLGRDGRPVWRCAIASSGSIFSLRQIPEFKAIADQFAQHNRALKRPDMASWLIRALASFPGRTASPREIMVFSWRLLSRAVQVVLMVMGAVLLLTLWLQRAPAAPGAIPAPVAHQAGTLPAELRDRTLGESLSPTEMAVVANITREVGVQMRPSGQPFVIFSDPNCPSCKDLEQKLAQVDPRFVPVIVPVAFKDGSEAAVRRILCAKDTQAAWSAEIGGAPATGENDGSCAGAAEKVTKANGAFVALNFSGTPTLVSASGKVVAGSGTVDAINAWLDANGGLPATGKPAPLATPATGAAN